jgi:hypothetical protein
MASAGSDFSEIIISAKDGCPKRSKSKNMHRIRMRLILKAGILGP